MVRCFIILLFIILFSSLTAQPCNSHDDCTTNLPCTIPVCINGVCRFGNCQDIEIDCKKYNGTCTNRKCNWVEPCCCFRLRMIQNNEEWKIPYYLRMEKRKLDQQYAEATKPEFDVNRFHRIKKNKERCQESLKS